jgi:hypothetical protein
MQFISNNPSIGKALLGLSLILIISGASTAFSRKERKRIRETVTAELPDRTALINASNADKVAQLRGYYTLGVGIIFFGIWCSLFGLSSLAVGV